MSLTKGPGKNGGTISPGLSINLKATHKQLAERAAVWWPGGSRLYGARGDKLSAHMRLAGGDSAQKIRGFIWISAQPLSASPRNKPGCCRGNGTVYGSPNEGVGRPIEFHHQFPPVGYTNISVASADAV